MLVKLTPGVDFINIWRSNFLYKSASRSLSLVTFWLCNFLAQKYQSKRLVKMLMKLTPEKLELIQHTDLVRYHSTLVPKEYGHKLQVFNLKKCFRRESLFVSVQNIRSGMRSVLQKLMEISTFNWLTIKGKKKNQHLHLIISKENVLTLFCRGHSLKS